MSILAKRARLTPPQKGMSVTQGRERLGQSKWEESLEAQILAGLHCQTKYGALSLETLQTPDTSPSFSKASNPLLRLHSSWINAPDAGLMFPPRGISSIS